MPCSIAAWNAAAMRQHVTRWTLLLSSLLLCASFVTACNRFPTFRYRLTVDVDTPEGLRSGSSVIEVSASQGPALPGPEAGGIISGMRGEAVAVDLGSRGLLFVLLSRRDDPDYAAKLPFRALRPVPPDKGGDGSAFRNNIRALINMKEPAVLATADYPRLVRFRDPAQPWTAEFVPPGDLASFFGPGVSIGKMRVEITDSKISTGINRTLTWLPSYKDRHLDGSPSISSNPHARSAPAELGPGSFSTEL